MNEIPLKVEIKRIDEVAIILLAANFYTSNTMAQNLKAALQEIFKDNQYYIIANMNGVESIDSEGLGALSYGYKTCIDNGGNFVMCHLDNPDVADVIEIVNLDQIIPVYTTEEEALKAIKD
jgi:anti-anti-sigma factor